MDTMGALYLVLAIVLGLSMVLSVLILLWLKEYFKYERYLKRFNGPNPMPIVGNALEFNTSSALLPGFHKYQIMYNGNFRIYLGFEPYVIVGEPKLAEFLLSSTTILRKTRPYGFLCNWLGNGILTSPGDQKWKQHRKIMTPGFHFNALESFVDVFNTTSDILVSLLEERVGKGSFNICPYLTYYALDVICETSMGISIHAQKNPTSEYVKSAALMCKMLIERTLTATQQYDFTYQLSQNYRNEKKALAILHNHTNSVIQRRKEVLKETERTENTKRGKALLDILLKHNAENNSFTDQELREEVDTMMFAGHDTTATALQFILYCLSNNVDIQTRAYEEVMAVLDGDKTKEPTYQDLLSMKYLDMVIKESLRMYPSVPLIGRLLEQDVEFDGGILPKGLSCLINVSGMHRDPNLFENPDTFNPDRFLTENDNRKSPFQYVPFSAGPRNCIGQKFAMLEMKSALAKILKNFEILAPIPKHELQLVTDCVLKTENGVNVHIRHRVCPNLS